MQIVIDIPENIYDTIQTDEMISREQLAVLQIHILNGIPLPKGHGRLVDADDIALIDEQFYVPSDYYVAESAINDAPTIIEADTAEGSEVKE